jgi:thiol-disulfide isomerase/thioredoxin
MKASLLLLSLLCCGVASAAIETWTNKDGKTAELELLKVLDQDGQKAGEFKTKNGKTLILKASDLAPMELKRLESFLPAATTPQNAAAPTSVFDAVLDGNLVRLQGKSLKRCEDATKPTKYYLFYYTASWCGPCQKFTPSLVEFYDTKKPGTNDFELILVTSDNSEEDMETYAVEKKMKWPQLKFSKVEKFSKEFKHPGTGIPNLVLTDLKGNIVKASYENGQYVGPNVVMAHLAKLLKP